MYAFLSEASHPNAAQNSWFQMAGPPISNWDNLAFKVHGHKLLTELVEILECTGRHIQADFVAVLEMANEYLP
jgi:hypothetical protein